MVQPGPHPLPRQVQQPAALNIQYTIHHHHPPPQVEAVETACSPSSMEADNMTPALLLMETTPGAPPRWTALVSMCQETGNIVKMLPALAPLLQQLLR